MRLIPRLQILPRHRQIHCPDAGGEVGFTSNAEVGLGPHGRAAELVAQPGVAQVRDEGYAGCEACGETVV